MLGTKKYISRCNMMTSQQIQHGGRTPLRKKYEREIVRQTRNWSEDVESRTDMCHMTKKQISEIQDGRQSPF